jgi:hypothetical protein
MTAFDLTMQLPADVDFAPMVRDLALHGARQCGCADSIVTAFGREVEAAARQALAGAAGAQPIHVAVRRDQGPMEVTIGSGDGARTMTLEV